MEDEDGVIHLKNLKVLAANTEEDALNYLFLGDANRMVAETPMNDASTRSHCMFVIWVRSWRADSDTVRLAKLHLVDLAGSERISKTGVEGNLQKEARYINLSLHYLEQVITALHRRSQGYRDHVPYRNSMMTSVLRDSLGGNCRTVMVATVATEEASVDESLSTCRFAQNVASIKNNATVNEELDPALMIKRLKKEVAQMKDELTLLSSNGEEEEELTERDLEECRQLTSTYLADPDEEALFVCGSVKRFQQCFRLLREVYERKSEGTAGRPMSASPALGSIENTVLELRQQVAKRDEEIAMLVSSLGKGPRPAVGVATETVQLAGRQQERSVGDASVPHAGGVQPQVSLLDRNKAFDHLRKSMRRTETLEENKEAVKLLYIEAKALGDRANSARECIKLKKQRIEKLRMERVMSSSPRDPDAPPVADTPEMAVLQKEVEEQRLAYQQATERLKKVKEDIDQYQKRAEQSKQRLQKDFDTWLQQAGGLAPEQQEAQAERALDRPSSQDRPPSCSVSAPASAAAPDDDPDIAAYFAAMAELQK